MRLGRQCTLTDLGARMSAWGDGFMPAVGPGLVEDTVHLAGMKPDILEAQCEGASRGLAPCRALPCDGVIY